MKRSAIVRLRRSNRGADDADVGAVEHRVEGRGELAVSIVDQGAGQAMPWEVSTTIARCPVSPRSTRLLRVLGCGAQLRSGAGASVAVEMPGAARVDVRLRRLATGQVGSARVRGGQSGALRGPALDGCVTSARPQIVLEGPVAEASRRPLLTYDAYRIIGGHAVQHQRSSCDEA